MNLFTSLLPVASLLIGFGLSFVLQTHTRRVQERFEDGRRWHKDKRETYSRFLSACSQMSSSFGREMLDIERGTPDHKSMETSSAFGTLMEAFGEVRLIGSPAVIKHGHRFLDAATHRLVQMACIMCDESYQVDLDTHLDHSRLRAQAMEAMEEEMLNEMRSELGTASGRSEVLHGPGPKRESWWPWPSKELAREPSTDETR